MFALAIFAFIRRQGKNNFAIFNKIQCRAMIPLEDLIDYLVKFASGGVSDHAISALVSERVLKEIFLETNNPINAERRLQEVRQQLETHKEVRICFFQIHACSACLPYGGNVDRGSGNY